MFTTAEYQQRIALLQAKLLVHDLDAYIVRTDTNGIYLTGVDYHSMERPVLIVVPAQGEPTLIVPRMEQEQLGVAPAIKKMAVYWELEAKQGRGWVESLHAVLGSAQRVGVEPLAEIDLVSALADYEWQALPLVEDLRVIKSSAEVALTRRVADYWTQIMNAMLAKAKAGVPLSTLMAAAAEHTQPIMDKEPQANWINSRFVQFFQCAPASGSPHHFSYRADEVLPNGPTVINAVGAIGHYNAENERTILTGSYTKEHAELFDLAQQAQQMAFDLIKPGVRCADVDCAIQTFFIKEGVGEHMRHRVGHGFGIEPHERPYTSEGSEEVYQPNMVISVEPGLYVDGVGGFRHSDTVLITTTGMEVLSDGTPTERRYLSFE